MSKNPGKPLDPGGAGSGPRQRRPRNRHVLDRGGPVSPRPPKTGRQPVPAKKGCLDKLLSAAGIAAAGVTLLRKLK